MLLWTFEAKTKRKPYLCLQESFTHCSNHKLQALLAALCWWLADYLTIEILIQNLSKCNECEVTLRQECWCKWKNTHITTHHIQESAKFENSKVLHFHVYLSKTSLILSGVHRQWPNILYMSMNQLIAMWSRASTWCMCCMASSYK